MLKREDARTGKRLYLATRLFVGALVMAGGSLAWVVLSTGQEGGVAGKVPSLFLMASAVLVLASAVTAIVAYHRLWRWYRCPQCHAPLPRVRDKGMRLRYQCDKCRVEWDTGWDDVPEGD
jgi:hypothetical protein